MDCVISPGPPWPRGQGMSAIKQILPHRWRASRYSSRNRGERMEQSVETILERNLLEVFNCLHGVQQLRHAARPAGYPGTMAASFTALTTVTRSSSEMILR